MCVDEDVVVHYFGAYCGYEAYSAHVCGEVVDFVYVLCGFEAVFPDAEVEDQFFSVVSFLDVIVKFDVSYSYEMALLVEVSREMTPNEATATGY